MQHTDQQHLHKLFKLHFFVLLVSIYTKDWLILNRTKLWMQEVLSEKSTQRTAARGHGGIRCCLEKPYANYTTSYLTAGRAALLCGLMLTCSCSRWWIRFVAIIIRLFLYLFGLISFLFLVWWLVGFTCFIFYRRQWHPT